MARSRGRDRDHAERRRGLLNAGMGRTLGRRDQKIGTAGTDDHGQPAPRALRLDGKAFELFDEQRQEAMRRARAASGLVAGWHGKNPGRILRLALVFELLAWAARGDGAIDMAAMVLIVHFIWSPGTAVRMFAPISRAHKRVRP